MVNELKMELAESQNQRDARIEQLWKRLDFQRKGELDWKALQKGLKKIDHRQPPLSIPIQPPSFFLLSLAMDD